MFNSLNTPVISAAFRWPYPILLIGILLPAGTYLFRGVLEYFCGMAVLKGSRKPAKLQRVKTRMNDQSGRNAKSRAWVSSSKTHRDRARDL
jgi:hypothetical protein